MDELNNVSGFVARAAERCGFVRERYDEGKLPEGFGGFLVVPFFGDQKHEFVLASLLLHRLREVYPGRYLVLCGWPGHAGLFPYVDEYWGLRDEGPLRGMLQGAEGFACTDPRALAYERQLNRYFETLPYEELAAYYDCGLTSRFFDRFRFVQYVLPSQPGPKVELVRELAGKPGYKVLLQPTRRVRGWHRGGPLVSDVRIEFWRRLVDGLLAAGVTPVLWQDASTWDLSATYADRCPVLSGLKILDLFAAMRACGCVLDLFSGLSRYAVAARTPFVAVTDRQGWEANKEYELDDLCANQIPHRYIFSHSTMLDEGGFVESVSARLKKFLPTVDLNRLPSTLEQSLAAPYLLVRERKAKRLGVRFIKVPKV